MGDVVSILMSGLFSAAILFLVAAGLQLVFGVMKIFNLAVGSFYALGAFFGATLVNWAVGEGLPQPLFFFGLLIAGILLGVIGPVIERLLRPIYDRDEAFQLLLTFAIVLMLEDITMMIWGSQPRSTGSLYLVYGTVNLLGATVPVYNLFVIAAAGTIAVGIGLLLSRTAFGRVLRAAADKREMVQSLGVNTRRLYVIVFSLGVVLSTIGGALVIPVTATMSEMGVELIVEAFAVVVIGGLGSMRGALVGALVVGYVTTLSINYYPPIEMLVIYLVVIVVLVIKPRGLFGGETA